MTNKNIELGTRSELHVQHSADQFSGNQPQEISSDKTHWLNSADVKNQDDSFSKDPDLNEIYTGDVVSVHLCLMHFWQDFCGLEEEEDITAFPSKVEKYFNWKQRYKASPYKNLQLFGDTGST